MYLRQQRDRAIFDAYNKALRERGFGSQSEAINYVRLHSAPKFYITPEFCSIIIGRMLRGEPMGLKGKQRVRKFQELYTRFIKMRETDASMPIREICTIIVEQEAPEFYLNYRATSGIIKQQKELCLKELSDKWARYEY